jgi:hypothetical protein
VGIVTTDFARLQARLVDLWPTIRGWSDDEQTVVVVPSYSLDAAILESVKTILSAYEERFLYMLLLLRQRNCHLVFVTSLPVRPVLIDAYLSLLPGVDPDEARSRLHLVCADDPSARPLAAKILERPDLLERINSHVTERAHLAMFNITDTERDLALRLHLPIFGASPEHAWFGTKTGCRKLFDEEDVAHARGEAVASVADARAALARLRDVGVTDAVVKLDEGVSGMGNAIVSLRAGDPIAEVDASLLEQLDEQGGVVEELVTGDGLRSPSAQLRITPLGDVEMLSTHDQLLAGPSGQTYIGCSFPADEAYAPRIAAESMKVGRRLAAEGVQGRLAVDFVVRPSGSDWAVYAIEINLRKGGTTHPFLTMHFLSDGVYDAESAVYTAADGAPRYYVAADSLGHHGLRGGSIDAVLAAGRDAGLMFDGAAGVVFHMLSALEPEGKFGLTAIGRTREQADLLWQDAATLVAGAVTASVGRATSV